RDEGGWEVIWFGGKRHAEDAYTDLKQNPFSGTSGGISNGGTTGPHHTIYSLNFIPIGGFVRMPGENGDANDPDGNYDPQSFAAKSAGKRIIVLCAGVTMNVILAMVLFAIAYGLGEPTYPAVIAKVAPGSPAAIAGLRAGDTIVSVNGQPVKLFSDVQNIVTNDIVNDNNQHAALPIALQIKHAGEDQLVSTTVNVREHPPAGQGPMGIEEKIVFVSSPFWQAPFKGVRQAFVVTGDFVGQIS